MSSPVKIGHLTAGAVWLTVYSSVPPSREVIGSSEGLTVSLTVFGDDPDEPLEGKELIRTGLVRAVDQFLVSSGLSVGLAVAEVDGKVEWEADDQKIVTGVSFAATEGFDSAMVTHETDCLTELAVVLGFNNKKISDDQVTSAIKVKYDDELPEGVSRSVDRLLAHLGSRLQVAFPSCFNPIWSKRLRNDLPYYSQLLNSIGRILSRSTDPIKAQALESLQQRIRAATDQHQVESESGSSGDRTASSTLALLVPSMAATARQLLATTTTAKPAPINKSKSKPKSKRSPAAHVNEEDDPMDQTVDVGEGGGGSRATPANTVSQAVAGAPLNVDFDPEDDAFFRDDDEAEDWWQDEGGAEEAVEEIVELDSGEDERDEDKEHVQEPDGVEPSWDWADDEADKLSWGDDAEGQDDMAGLEFEFDNTGFSGDEEVGAVAQEVQALLG